VVELARLESVLTPKALRGFESLPFRKTHGSRSENGRLYFPGNEQSSSTAFAAVFISPPFYINPEQKRYPVKPPEKTAHGLSAR
jgi:hypothetical protein